MQKLKAALLVISLCSIMIPISCNDSDGGETDTPDRPKVPVTTASVVDHFPHDTSSFTQGLVIYEGFLYESTGNYAKSRLKKFSLANLKSGKPDKEVALETKYFGEGVTILNDTIYQLTWKEHTVLVYSLDLKLIKTFPITTDGWGITSNGKELIVSDGTSKLYYYDPSFNLIRTQNVTESGTLGFNINELEYIDGFIYANQWQYQYILKIDPGKGEIISKIDLSQIWEQVKKTDALADVPNGIAYDPSTKKLYVTGKYWPEMYEIRTSL